MKKQGSVLIILCAALCFAFCMGYFLGTNRPGPAPEITVMEPVPTVRETEPAKPGLININTADAQQLCLLPGIGESIARRILDYRETVGFFRAPEDLLNISGIGEKTLAGLLPYITTGG